MYCCLLYTSRSKEAAQSAAALKAARDSYQDVLHSSVMDELAALWDARAALEAARADCTSQEQKLAECREMCIRDSPDSWPPA